MLLRAVEQRSRPTILDDNKDSKGGGTAQLVPFPKSRNSKSTYTSMQYSPRFVGLAARPRAATPPHSQSSKLSRRWAELAALPRGCSGASCSMTPYLRPPQERAVSPPAWRGLDWRHGVGRLRRTVRRPSGSLGGLSNMRPIVLADCGLLNTRRDTAPRRHDLRQSGGGKPKIRAGLLERQVRLVAVLAKSQQVPSSRRVRGASARSGFGRELGHVGETSDENERFC